MRRVAQVAAAIGATMPGRGTRRPHHLWPGAHGRIIFAMISRVHSSILQGIDAIGCEVEADVVPSADKPEIRLLGPAD